MPEHVVHGIDPVFDRNSRVLVLGSIPSPKSREEGFFYGHPRNRFWQVLAAAFDEPAPATIEDKRDLLLRRHIALWDVVASCDIEGASDASIRNAEPNDLDRIFSTADIEAVFATGAKAGELYARLCEKRFGKPCTTLPSTSPANAKESVESLTKAYAAALLEHLNPFEPPVLDVKRVVELERRIEDAGSPLSTLMRRAGRALAHKARAVAEAAGCGADARFAILCGNGNNGGDGWVAARVLTEEGFGVDVICATTPADITAHPARAAALEAQRVLEGRPNARIVARPDAVTFKATLAQTHVAIDALLGTGFEHDTVRAPFDGWIEAVCDARSRGLRVVAADVPSGMNAQTGKAARPCIKADATVTMIASKPGLATPYAFAFCGETSIASIAYIEPLLADASRGAEQAEYASACVENDAAPSPAKAAKRDANAEFLRAEAEDDDGYDPYSDRKPEPEPLFQSDPWS